MRNPSNFLDNIKEAQDKQSEYGQRSYEQKILKAMVCMFDYTVSDIRKAYYESDDDDVMSEIRYNTQDSLLDSLFIRKTKPSAIKDFIYRLDKTDAWKHFCRIHDEETVTLFGMVFPIKGESDWIMHTLGMVGVPGKGRIIVPSNRAALRDIIIEPLKHFIEGRKE